MKEEKEKVKMRNVQKARSDKREERKVKKEKVKMRKRLDSKIR